MLTAGAVIASAPAPVQTEDPELALAPSVPTDVPSAVPTTAADQTAHTQPTAAPTAAAYVGTQFERILRPFLAEASRRRQARAAADPNYWTRIDPKLNASRLNFLLFGYGETHEPPLTERAFIGSLTIFSYDYRTKSIDLVSLTHDIRAPEMEQALRATGQTDVGPIKIDRTYSFGGFDVMGRTVEDATGLSIDFQLAFKEAAIAAATDDVFGGLDVDVPLAFDVNAYYLDGVKYPGGSFTKGMQHLNGQQVIQFIKTVPVEEHYDASLEHNARKHLVFRSIMDSLGEHSTDVAFMSRAALFFTSQVANESIAYDFDLKPLLVDNLRSMMMDIGRSAPTDTSMPGIARTMYIVDPASGDGGVQWVKANARDNPVTARDINENKYGELAMEVPYHGDPYAPDLVTGYWPDVRKVVLQHLTS
ncbi:MAG: LCP family protein [Chloroflexi bacterium]|nr:LCP family protein [Chloroflexota bacterium]